MVHSVGTLLIQGTRRCAVFFFSQRLNAFGPDPPLSFTLLGHELVTWAPTPLLTEIATPIEESTFILLA